MRPRMIKILLAACGQFRLAADTLEMEHRLPCTNWPHLITKRGRPRPTVLGLG